MALIGLFAFWPADGTHANGTVLLQWPLCLNTCVHKEKRATHIWPDNQLQSITIKLNHPCVVTQRGQHRSDDLCSLADKAYVLINQLITNLFIFPGWLYLRFVTNQDYKLTKMKRRFYVEDVLAQRLVCPAHSNRLTQWALKMKTMIFRPILGPANVWDSFLVSHIKVEGKYNFSFRVRTQALLQGFWGRRTCGRSFDLTSHRIWQQDLVFRWWLYGLALMTVGLRTVIGIM